MIRFILFLFRPFKWFIEKMGADYNQFIRILQLKLTLDNRSAKGFNRSPEKERENMLIKQTLGYIVFGGLFGLFLSIIKSPFTFYYFSHIFLMVLMAMSIISEFTTILFDTSENVIIQPLPIKGNTLNLARNAHIFTYLILMAFSLSIIWIIISLIRFGSLSALVFVFTIFLNILFTLFLANILYLGIMRVASGERLKNVLMYFQIVVAILFMGGYQFGMKLVDTTNIKDMILPVNWYTYLLPPAFFSGMIDSLTTLNFDKSHLLFTAEALVVPLAAIYFTGKYLTPLFNRKLMDLEQGDRNSKGTSENSGISLWYRMMSPIFVFNREEKASFRLMWKMTGRERLFKQTFFPSIGYIVILIVAQFISKPVPFNELIKGDKYLFSLYFLLFIGATLPQSLIIGNFNHAGWIFKTIPLHSPATFFKGCINAAFAKFIVPFYLVVGTAVCSVWGFRVAPDVIIVLLVTYLFTILFYYFQTPSFPFSMEKSASQSGLTMIRVFIIMALATAAGLLHHTLLHRYLYANLILIPLYSGLIIYMNRILVYRKITWNAVDRVNDY
jgi:ABC-2 type transport system permease protein